jgi:hypothetical protein
MSQHDMKDRQRLQLLRELYETAHNETESFEQEDVGADLAYLMGAVLEDSHCSWEADRPLVRLLREHLPSSHAAWEFIHIETEEPEKKDLSV